MKYLVPLILLVLLTSGCIRFQFLTISSPTPSVQKNANSQFFAENDSLIIMYDFKGADCPLFIKVTNKLDKAMLIDWKRSSIVINDEAVALMPGELVTTGVIGTGSVQVNHTATVSKSRFSSVTSVPDPLQQIPPRSFITRETMNITRGLFSLPASDYVKKEIDVGFRKKVKVLEAQYEEGQSPLRFRTFLTIMMDGEEKVGPVVFEHSFFVSEITNTKNGLVAGDRPYVLDASGATGVKR